MKRDVPGQVTPQVTALKSAAAAWKFRKTIACAATRSIWGEALLVVRGLVPDVSRTVLPFRSKMD